VKVLVVGGGGREHALGWALAKSPQCEKLYTAPGNAGTALIGENVAIKSDDLEALAAFAADNQIDLTVVGPEAPLVAGIVDRFRAAGLNCFGPTAAAARLEGSKVFAKEFMKKYNIPTAAFEVFNDPAESKRYIDSLIPPIVVKADGLAAGKGVIIAKTVQEAKDAVDMIMVDKKFGSSGRQIVIEQHLEGEEVSIHAICSGSTALVCPPSQDHKRIFNGDKGPNTGGMGAYSPVPRLSDSEAELILRTIIRPTLEGMAAEGSSYSGVLYAGLMLTADGPQVLEFNVRFGDPETQVIMPLIDDDLLQVLHDTAAGNPPAQLNLYRNRAAATVVMAAEGYPGSYNKGFDISGLDEAGTEHRVVFHAGTAEQSGRIVTSGGRVLAVTAWGDDLQQALGGAYEGIEKTRFQGAYWRTDIGHRAMGAGR
jgi:phosphoribosylamine--glycine ligase